MHPNIITGAIAHINFNKNIITILFFDFTLKNLSVLSEKRLFAPSCYVIIESDEAKNLSVLFYPKLYLKQIKLSLKEFGLFKT
jgi:hypothetical protein